MGYRTRVYGEIEIDPPVPWHVMRLNESLTKPDGLSCVVVEVDEHQVETDEGTLVKRVGARISAFQEDRFKASTLIEDVQAVVDALGRDRRYIGRLECEGEDAYDLWRVEVRDGVATKTQAQIHWPNGEVWSGRERRL